MTGQRFGRLVVLRELPRKSSKLRMRRCQCQCDCGTVHDVYAHNLLKGSTTSCGCRRKELSAARRTTHGHAKKEHSGASTEYQTWASMMSRCKNPKAINFHDYGGRGIAVCERWHKFENFLADMGRKPSPDLTIEREDNERGYEPGNCVWASQKTQNLNRRMTVKIEYRGQLVPLVTVAELIGLPVRCLRQRIFRLGWSVEQAVATPRLEYGFKRPK